MNHNAIITLEFGIILCLIIVLFFKRLQTHSLIKFLKNVNSGNTLARYKGGRETLVSELGKQINQLIQMLLNDTEIAENALQDKNLLMYQYIRFFLSVPSLYMVDEVVKITLEYCYKIFHTEAICILTRQESDWQCNVFQTVDENHPKNSTRSLTINESHYDITEPLMKNFIQNPDEIINGISDLVTPYNILQIPIVIDQNSVAVIQLINKKDKRDFDDSDMEIARTIAMAVANQLKIIEIIAEEKSEIKQLSSIINNISDGIIITDTSKQVLLENPAARDFFSLNPIKKDILIQQLFTTIDHPNMNLVLFKPERLVLLCRISEIPNNKGDVDKYIISLRNITETKRKEREKSEMLFLTATKMYQPMLHVKKTKEIFRFSSDPDIEERLLNDINLSFNLLNKLIFYAEIESGPMRLAKKPTNINYIIEKVIDSMGKLLRANKINIKLNLTDDIEKHMVDADRIEQIINTILSFIIKITYDDTKVQKLDIQTLYEDESIGIDMLHHKYHFDEMELLELTKKNVQLEKFMQSEQNLEDLNLEFAFINHITVSHGGKFRIINIAKKGTLYTIRIPI